ncbi:DeoR/GlpR family DNA-binding transcription regulator [Micromonospora yasonensis]|uniref:DeoR/GlpR family DNA-binding transcription regulator n=1 Tax=Micromonospora yasonensis TaxID=1128667 RepID=UPI00222F1215|nr:DeoR/GlpR family DNA-binding transcription regulator [Micromonospora yasonensis]MCW3839886.1 DeoR/GlpR family DNA-binding transcription regulator [Micromonospora yasonensis]
MSRQRSSQRRDQIVQMAASNGLTSVEELSARLGVTPSTIRRDLALLTAQGKLARTYGGALSLEPHPEASLRQRLGEAYAAKRAIAAWAAEQIVPGESVLLDAGSTMAALAQILTGFTNLSVSTIGLTALEVLAEAEDIEVVLLGGRLRTLSQSFVGPVTESALERMSFDRAFVGADGVRADRGINEKDLEQTRLKELMMSRADHVYVLAHGAKLGQAPFHAWAVMPSRWTLVTDDSAPADEVAKFREQGIRVVVVDPPASEAG